MIALGLKKGEEVLEAGDGAVRGVVGGEGLVQGGPLLRGEAFANHHLDEPAQATHPLQDFTLVLFLQHEGVEAVTWYARCEHPSPCGLGQVCILAFGVDDVVDDASGDASQQAQLGGEGLARARPGHDHGVGVEEGLVEVVEGDDGAGAQIQAEEGALPGVQVGGCKGKEVGQGGRVHRAPGGPRIECQWEGGMVALPLAEGHLVQGGHGACEEAPQLLAPLFDGLCGISVDGDGEGGVEKPLSSSMHLVPQTAGVFQGNLPRPRTRVHDRGCRRWPKAVTRGSTTPT